MATKELEVYYFKSPVIRRITIMESSGNWGGVNGRYWARVENYGIAGRFSESVDEVKQNVGRELRGHFIAERAQLSAQVEDLGSIINLIDSGNLFQTEPVEENKGVKKGYIQKNQKTFEPLNFQ